MRRCSQGGAEKAAAVKGGGGESSIIAGGSEASGQKVTAADSSCCCKNSSVLLQNAESSMKPAAGDVDGGEKECESGSLSEVSVAARSDDEVERETGVCRVSSLF